VPASRLNVPPPETTLRWLGDKAVDTALLQRLVALPSVWSAHDVIWSIQVRRAAWLIWLQGGAGQQLDGRMIG
jgi:hypothetical protein